MLAEGEVGYLLSNRLKKKDAPSICYKSTTDKKSFSSKETRFIVTHHFKNHRGTEFY